MSTVGVAMTRHNRHTVGDIAVEQWRRFTPDDIPFIVIDDASDPPVESTFRFDENIGVAGAKNKSIELLMDAGVEHLFLVDDDVWPIAPNWWMPYVVSYHRHMNFMHGRFAEPLKYTERGGCTFWPYARGVMLYVTRDVIDRVGGMRREFGKFWGEHTEWSWRIHNAGLTEHVSIDVAGSERLFMTISDALPHSIPQGEFVKEVLDARMVSHRFKGTDDFVEYR